MSTGLVAALFAAGSAVSILLAPLAQAAPNGAFAVAATAAPPIAVFAGHDPIAPLAQCPAGEGSGQLTGDCGGGRLRQAEGATAGRRRRNPLHRREHWRMYRVGGRRWGHGAATSAPVDLRQQPDDHRSHRAGIMAPQSLGPGFSRGSAG